MQKDRGVYVLIKKLIRQIYSEIAYLVVNTITFGTFAALFRCVPADRASDLMMVYIFLTFYKLLRASLFLWSGTPGFNC